MDTLDFNLNQLVDEELETVLFNTKFRMKASNFNAAYAGEGTHSEFIDSVKIRKEL